MSLQTDYVIIGKIGATYGIKGWLKITTFTQVADSVLDYTPWYLQENNTWRPMEVQDGRRHGKTIIAKLKGYDTPEAARLLTGRNIAVQRSQLAVLKQHEYYWSDLIGLNVVNQDGVDFGKIAYIMETGTNDVLVVKGEKEHGIPYLPGDVIINVDLENKVVHVNWDLI